MKAGCIVVCMGAPVSKNIQKLAINNCKIIGTPHDTYDGKIDEPKYACWLFTCLEGLISFHKDDFISDIKSVYLN